MPDVTVTLTDAEGEALMAVTAAGRWAVNGRPWDEQTTNAIRRARQKLVAAALDRARSPAPAPACSRCAFWRQGQGRFEGDVGLCARRAPTRDGVMSLGVWPATRANDSCGEYAAKESGGDA